MLTKVLALLIVVMLILPSGALAVGKPESIEGKAVNKTKTTETESDENGSARSQQLPPEAEKGLNNAPDDAKDKAEGSGREKADKIVAEKKAFKDAKVAEAKKIAEEKSAEAKHGAKGLTRAMEAITSKFSEVGESAAKALQSVIGKFTAWLGFGGSDDGPVEDGDTGES